MQRTTLELAKAVLANGKLIRTHHTVDGGPECGPYAVPCFVWRWGQLELCYSLALGYWHCTLYVQPHKTDCWGQPRSCNVFRTHPNYRAKWDDAVRHFVADVQWRAD